MQGISAQAGAGMENAYKFNAGTLLEERFEVNLYETPFRRYDAQIGRFTGIDILAEQTVALTPYQFGANDPIYFNDPTGAYLSSGINDASTGYTPFSNYGYGASRFNTRFYGGMSGEQFASNFLMPFGTDFFPGLGRGSGGTGYSKFWVNLWNKTPDGKDSKYSSEGTSTRYEYSNASRDGVFVTKDFHGVQSYTEGEMYYFSGTERVKDFKEEIGLGTAILDGMQTVFDVAGLVPVVGEAFDGANALIYAARGDYINAGLSGAAMIPIGGWLATGGKMLNKAQNSSNVLLNTSRQLQAKYKHAADFGVIGNYNKANAANFSSVINQHINSAGVQIINGTYRGQSVIHYLNPSNGLNVISSPTGQFISGWKLNPAQLQNILQHGGL